MCAGSSAAICIVHLDVRMSRADRRQSEDPPPKPRLRRPRGRRPGASPESGSPPGEAAEPRLGPPDPQSASPAGPSSPPFGWTFRDFLVPYVLLVLSAQRAHGYFIEQYLRGLGLVNVEMSTLYRTLRQLEKDGLVFSTW